MGLILSNLEDFSLKIERLVKKRNTSYMETVIDFCEENNVEYETVAKLISVPIKQKIKEEAEDLHFFPKVKKLPL